MVEWLDQYLLGPSIFGGGVTPVFRDLTWNNLDGNSTLELNQLGVRMSSSKRR